MGVHDGPEYAFGKEGPMLACYFIQTGAPNMPARITGDC
jgi:hypothetical protein